MNPYIERVKQQIEEHPPDFGDGNSILTLLYEAYNQVNRMDNEQIRDDFNTLYQAMNDMELREMDRIIYPVCTLCRDHEKAGFIAGIKVGVLLQSELAEK
jgi:hypothetical protein